MKNLFLPILFAFATLFGYSQEYWPDTIFHFEQGNSLFILDKFNYNCACGFKQEIEFNENTVSIFKVDTVPEMANCICSFEILTTFENLEIGEYLFNYYRVGKMADTSLVYSFTYNNELIPPVNIPAISSLAGACGEIVFSNVWMNKKEKEIKIYPNPADDVLQVTVPQNIYLTDICLLDATGRRIIIETSLSKNILIDFSIQVPGIYFLRCETSNTVVTKKIVKN